MSSAPLLYVCVRPQAGAAAAEYESFRAATRLDADGILSHDLVRSPLPDDVFERFSGFVVGGSPFNLTDPESTKTDVQRRLEADLERIAQAAADARTAAMFTCYGIGVVTRMLGGEVSRAHPEDTGPVSIELTADGQSDPLFGGLATPLHGALGAQGGRRSRAPRRGAARDERGMSRTGLPRG